MAHPYGMLSDILNKLAHFLRHIAQFLWFHWLTPYGMLPTRWPNHRHFLCYAQLTFYGMLPKQSDL